MRKPSAAAGIWTLAFGVLGLAWTVVEALPPLWGYEDTDSPGVMMEFLREHYLVYRIAGAILLVMALALIVSALAVADQLGSDQPRSLTLRVATAFAVIGAALFLAHGALRFTSTSALLVADGHNLDWGEAGYMAVQLVGTQTFAAGGALAMCVWAVGLSIHGFRTKALPTWLCVLGLLPAFRIVAGFGGLFGGDSSLLWVVYMLAIPGTTAWLIGLGIVLLRQRRRAAASTPGAAASSR